MAAAFILLFLMIVYRILMPTLGGGNEWLANFSPLASIVLCGSVYFPRKYAVLIPLLTMLVSDWYLNTQVYHVALLTPEILPRYAAFLLIGIMAYRIRRHPDRQMARLFGGSLLSSLLFYVITDSAAWAGNPVYSASLGGWLQALTTGEPGYSPTWTFFRNSLVSDLLFTGLFALCMKMTWSGFRFSLPASEPRPVTGPATSRSPE